MLVTGATGFIGAQVLEPLRRAGHELHAASRSVPESDSDVVWHSADLLAPGAVEQLRRKLNLTPPPVGSTAHDLAHGQVGALVR